MDPCEVSCHNLLSPALSGVPFKRLQAELSFIIPEPLIMVAPCNPAALDEVAVCHYLHCVHLSDNNITPLSLNRSHLFK